MSPMRSQLCPCAERHRASCSSAVANARARVPAGSHAVLTTPFLWSRRTNSPGSPARPNCRDSSRRPGRFWPTGIRVPCGCDPPAMGQAGASAIFSRARMLNAVGITQAAVPGNHDQPSCLRRLQDAHPTTGGASGRETWTPARSGIRSHLRAGWICGAPLISANTRIASAVTQVLWSTDGRGGQPPS